MLPDTPPSGSDPAWASSSNFVQVPLPLVAAIGNWPAAVCWARIAYKSHLGPMVATIAEIADDLQMGESQTRAALQYLRELGLITATRASSFDPTLIWGISWAAARDGEKLSHEDEETLLTVTKKISVTPSSKKVRTTPPKPGPEFDVWWGLYPRKVGKQAAVKAWVKALKTTTAQVLLTALSAQVPELKDANSRGYCPHPATWLNSGRWEDEPSRALRPVADLQDEEALPPPPSRDMFA